ncbi:GDSL esterase/lipase At2g04570-like [Tasmannia lanceolata]|uniref:GDSL esterase/lipase At2g04570-like n=1 Tax=Tasmannia lanceolata TaxID=3420 RepID=UPI00406340AC
MSSYTTISWILLLQIFRLAVETGAKVPAIIVFGDSSVDAGNNNQLSTIAKSNFEPYGRDFTGGLPTGRFSNGRIATDFISQAFGIKPTIPAYLDPMYSIKDFATGVCFASAGTGYDNSTSNVLNVIPLWKQLEYLKDYQKKLRTYQGNELATSTLSEALYLISIGTNDYLENYYVFPDQSSRFTITEYQNYLVGIAGSFIREIYHLGGRKISLGSLPPMGCLPLERATNFMSGSSCRNNYNKVAMDFNAKLKGLVDQLRVELVGSKVVYSDVYDKYYEVIENPSAYGFTNVAVGCCATGSFEMGYMCDRMNPFTCTDASKYVFWDAFHPTEKMNSIMADNAMKTSLAEFV